jgi:hypothetical protein
MTKPRKSGNKVEEPAAAYGASEAPAIGKPEIRYASAKDIEATNREMMRVHRETLRKLAK